MPSSPEPLAFSFEELYEDAPCGYLTLRPDGTIAGANRTFYTSTGYTAQDVVGARTLTELMAPGSQILQATTWGPTLDLAGEVREVALELVRATGERLPVLLNAMAVRDDTGAVVAIRASIFDAGDRQRYERELVAARDTERKGRERVERLYAELEARSAQQAVVVELGVRALEGLEPRDLLAEAARAVAGVARIDAVAITRTEGSAAPRVVATEGPPIAADGADEEGVLREVVGCDIGPPGDDAFGRIWIGTRSRRRSFTAEDRAFLDAVAHVLWNAAERRRTITAAEFRALHDPLTGLPNRRFLSQRLRQEIASGHEFGLCLLDLDDFKLINDSLGHLAGDELLRAVADRLRGTVRGEDMVARLGGDEFVVLCKGDEAEALGQRVADVLAAPFRVAGIDHVVLAGVGVVRGDRTSDPEDLLRDADVAMYRAKGLGRGVVVRFDEAMRDEARQRLAVQAGLRVALSDGQLRVFYQPVVCAGTGRTLSMEALVRWEHPERGLVPPGDFIPVAEASGLIVGLGRFVLREACSQLVAWRGAGLVDPAVSVAVNVSGRQLMSPGFVDVVRSALSDSGLAATPELLGLEITETVFMDGSEVAAATVRGLAELDVKLLLDDFGTGTSSLARLKRLPMDTLKIDRAFISGLGSGKLQDRALVAAIMGMAAGMGLDVIAEGVETTEQLEELTALGCDRIQGFLFSRPLTAQDMEARLTGQMELSAAA